MGDITTVNLRRNIVKELASMRKDGETYSDVVSRLIEVSKNAYVQEVKP